jgi:hypothetical protein
MFGTLVVNAHRSSDFDVDGGRDLIDRSRRYRTRRAAWLHVALRRVRQREGGIRAARTASSPSANVKLSPRSSSAMAAPIGVNRVPNRRLAHVDDLPATGMGGKLLG